ncbi:DUF192 domain-containing protein [Rhizobium sp. ARZ01]|uniref:DUF192 domain-containing protein n=1 Tax=Rhizobium sp. ARZ01 TaxID=2769313 RepID=UPI0017810EDE|nr:DUF192 domain-containing protein [Rhizobium sp. ARZ01]MBD9372253.1 DUF192 domain-containing protein [Rhizobium sp. ARZ01]
MAILRRLFAGSLCSALAALFLLGLSSAPGLADEKFEEGRLAVVTADGKRHEFSVELALTPSQRAQGLMNRHTMAPDHGMLFSFGETRLVMMWMKDTYLPLDMLFIDTSGKIRTIKENAEPLSEAIISSNVPVAFVLELNAGTVRAKSIKPGDTVESPLIQRGDIQP